MLLPQRAASALTPRHTTVFRHCAVTPMFSSSFVDIFLHTIA